MWKVWFHGLRFVTLACCFGVALASSEVARGQTRNVSLVPSSSAINVGGSVVLQVQIDDPSGVTGYTLGIVYPAGLLNVTAATALVGGGCSAVSNFAVDGSVCLALACSTPLSGTNVSLFDITFQGEANGLANVSFASTSCGGPPINACLLEDGSGGSIPCNTTGATIQVGPTPTPTSTETSSPTATITPTASVTATPTNTVPPSPTPSATETRTESPTPSPTASPSITATPTLTATPSVTPTVTNSPTASVTPTSTQTPTQTPTSSPTRTPTETPVRTPPPVPVIPTPLGGAGAMLVGGLGAAIAWMLRRVGRKR